MGAGSMLKTAFAPSMANCCSECSATKGCEGFSYFEQTCYLKANVTGTFHNPGRRTRCVGLQCPGHQKETLLLAAALPTCQRYKAMQEDTDLAGTQLAVKP